MNNYYLSFNKSLPYHIQLQINDGVLEQVVFLKNDKNVDRLEGNSYVRDSYIIQQFKKYLKNPHYCWDIDLNWDKLSSFQIKVLKRLIKIPIGEVVTYGYLANDLKTSARAIGNACRNNPFPLVIPCHRVVAKNGLGGYDGDANKNLSGKLKIKQFLLNLEKSANI